MRTYYIYGTYFGEKLESIRNRFNLRETCNTWKMNGSSSRKKIQCNIVEPIWFIVSL